MSSAAAAIRPCWNSALSKSTPSVSKTPNHCHRRWPRRDPTNSGISTSRHAVRNARKAKGRATMKSKRLQSRAGASWETCAKRRQVPLYAAITTSMNPTGSLSTHKFCLLASIGSGRPTERRIFKSASGQSSAAQPPSTPPPPPLTLGNMRARGRTRWA
jgi:hypothetical protein